MYVKCYQTGFWNGQRRLDLITSADICRGSNWGLIFFAKVPVTNRELMQEIGCALGEKLRIILLPKFVFKIAMYIFIAIAFLFKWLNQFDYKQYKEMTAPSFICTNDLLTAETNVSATTVLLDAIRMSVDGYRKLKWL
jgi:hypothetical protein